ncbi:FAD-binding domain-containing protein [Apiospora phragmitis]|uniref:FAD-binding domain-containing protein n=1 Tax=Apiospora phragmitis TaxID=2905665 RepID=A0ABR1TY68_9PEZI
MVIVNAMNGRPRPPHPDAKYDARIESYWLQQRPKCGPHASSSRAPQPRSPEAIEAPRRAGQPFPMSSGDRTNWAGSNNIAGGFLLGGGNMFYTSIYGLGCDSVVEYEVILADGRIVTAEAKGGRPCG